MTEKPTKDIDAETAVDRVGAPAERATETKLKLAKYLQRLDAEYSDVTAQWPAA